MLSQLARNKKGASIILMIFEVVVVLLVGYIALTVATNYSQSEGIMKIHAANDLSMMINTLVAAPGDVKIEYPVDMSLYQITFTEDEIVIKPLEGTFPEEVRRKFHLPASYEFFVKKGSIEGVARICLFKEQTTITLGACDES